MKFYLFIYFSLFSLINIGFISILTNRKQCNYFTAKDIDNTKISSNYTIFTSSKKKFTGTAKVQSTELLKISSVNIHKHENKTNILTNKSLSFVNKEIQYIILFGNLHREKFVMQQIMSLLFQNVKKENIWIFTCERIENNFKDIINPSNVVHMPENGKTHIHKISNNFKFVFETMFAKHEACVFLEDDLLLSIDMVYYFKHCLKVMKLDKTIMAASAFNINSLNFYWNDSSAIYRTNTFEGLGWMTTKEQYQQKIKSLIEKKPLGQPWDAALADNIGSRECLYPEVPRTFHNSDSKGKNLDLMALNLNSKKNVTFSNAKNLVFDTYNKNLENYIHKKCNTSQITIFSAKSDKDRIIWDAAFKRLYKEDFNGMYGWGIGRKPKGGHFGLVILKTILGKHILIGSYSRFARICQKN